MLRRVAGLTIAALCLIGTASAMASPNNKPCPVVPPYGTGTLLDDKIVGCPEKDILYGLAGNDRLWGGQDPDMLVGGAGNDIIHAVDAQSNTSTWEDDRADTVNGGPGWDLCFVSSKDHVTNCEAVIPG